MYIPLTWIWVYLGAVNLLAVLMTVWDKRKAKKKKRRILESDLLWVAAAGGSPLMLLAMLLVRHKTKHPKFLVGLPFILLVQGAVVFLLWRVGCFPN